MEWFSYITYVEILLHFPTLVSTRSGSKGLRKILSQPNGTPSGMYYFSIGII